MVQYGRQSYRVLLTPLAYILVGNVAYDLLFLLIVYHDKTRMRI